MTIDPGWTYVGVAGISSCEKVGDELLPVIRVRMWHDITDIAPGAQGRVSGTVTGDGAPVVDAKVELMDGDEVLEFTYTATDGTYSIAWMPGMYAVRVTAGGFQPETKPATLVGGHTTTLDFELFRYLGT